MPNCGQISANILIDCNNPMTGGVNDRLILINKVDWDLATLAGTPTLITGITLPTGSVAYQYEGKNNSVEPRAQLVKQRYAEVYDHEVMFKVFKADAATKAQLELLAKGKVVAIIENNYKGASGAAAFEVYGIDTGLYVQDLERTLADVDTQGAFAITLRTSDQSKESHLPATLYDTDYATTKAIVDGLLA